MRTEPTVLCVDDELSILAAMSRQLRTHCKVSIANSGAEALEILQHSTSSYWVIISDMMMPGMNGAEFLRRSRELSPQSIRVLLTGHTDATLAAAAVNEGAISHYLTKPCSTERMIETLETCFEAYRCAAAERDVLEETMRGAVDALAQTLAIVSPAVFARVDRVRLTVPGMIARVKAPDGWAIEVAVPLSQMGAITLPDAVRDRWASGQQLTKDDGELIADVADVSVGIIRPIPRLGVVCDIIEGAAHPERIAVPHPGSQILRVAFALDVYESGGLSRTAAITVLRERLGDIVDDLVGDLGDDGPGAAENLSIDALTINMRLASNVLGDGGVLLVGRGALVTPILLARLHTLRGLGSIAGGVWVQVDQT